MGLFCDGGAAQVHNDSVVSSSVVTCKNWGLSLASTRPMASNKLGAWSPWWQSLGATGLAWDQADSGTVAVTRPLNGPPAVDRRVRC